MKKILITITFALMSMLHVTADNYDYLVVQKTDGTTQAFTALGLSITFTDGNMVLKQDNNSTTLALSELSKMLFSATTDVDGIEVQEFSSSKVQELVIYDISGRKLQTSNFKLQTLPKGVYILNGKKIVVK